MVLTVAGRDSCTPEILGKNSGRSGLVCRITFVVMYSKRERINVVCVCAHPQAIRAGSQAVGERLCQAPGLDTFPTITV